MQLMIEIDESTLRAAMARTGLSDQRAAIETWLRQHLMEPHPYDAVLALFGTGCEDGYDPKAGQPNPWEERDSDR